MVRGRAGWVLKVHISRMPSRTEYIPSFVRPTLRKSILAKGFPGVMAYSPLLGARLGPKAVYLLSANVTVFLTRPSYGFSSPFSKMDTSSHVPLMS